MVESGRRRSGRGSQAEGPVAPETTPVINIVQSATERSPRSLRTRALSLFSGLRGPRDKTTRANTQLAGGMALPASSQPNLSAGLVPPATPTLRRRSLQSSRLAGSQETLSSGLGRSASLSMIKPLPSSSPCASPDPALAPTGGLPSQEPVSSVDDPSRDISLERYTAWRKALSLLDDEDRKVLDEGDLKACLTDLRLATEKKKEDCDKKRRVYKLGDKEVALRDIADNLIKWIDKFKQIGDLAVQYDPVHAALPWAGFRFLLMVVTVDREKQDAILVTLERLAGIIDRCAIYECLYLDKTKTMLSSADHLEKSLISLYSNLLIFLARSKRYLSHNTTTRIVIGIFEDDPNSLFSTIKAGEEEVHRCAEIVNMQYIKEVRALDEDAVSLMLRKLLESFEEPIRSIDLKLTRLEKQVSSELRSKILNWISPAPYLGHHNRAKEGRLENSCGWLLEQQCFADWQAGKSESLLWLHGIPGAGKTKLISSVIDTLLERKAAGSNEPLAFFDCHRNEAGRSAPEGILSSIARQLSSGNSDSSIPELVLDKYDLERKNGFSSGSFDVARARDLILALLPSYPQATIVIDALDECDRSTRASLIAAVKCILGSSSVVKIFISSREDSDIVRALKDVPNITISARLNSGDIERFVYSELDRRIENGDLLDGLISEGLKAAIRKTLIDKSDGMFMWVDLQIKEMCDSDRFHTEADLLEELGRLPVGLEETYDQIFKLISSYPRRSSILAKRSLQWLMCAARPLAPDELTVVISIPLSGDGDILGGLKLTRDKVIQLCHNLVIWDEQLNVMRFAHLSVFEFLEKKTWSVSSGHTLAAEVCLQLMCLPNSETSLGKEFKRQPVYERYCYKYWSHHVSLCDRLDARYSQILSLQRQLCQVTPDLSKAFRRMIGVKIVTLSPYTGRPIETPLCFAAAHGLIETVQYLLGLGTVAINEPCCEGGLTPLCWAAREGHDEICSLLLQSGADVDAKSADGSTPLVYACSYDKLSTVQLLLHHGSDIDVKTKTGLAVLDGALSREGMIQAIIKNMEGLGKAIPPKYQQYASAVPEDVRSFEASVPNQ
ncbi:hypothetical protein DFP73DRAFT_634572 [Morchella snyderi]|nr:hypothetical protein DFP73DRAFT_634572 [Morchella snyderi]